MAQFKDRIPEAVLAFPTTERFVDILDRVHQDKTIYIADGVRVHNPLLLRDHKWLVKQMKELGFSYIPSTLPIAVMEQILLNSDTLFGLLGSTAGIEMFLSVSSLGLPTFDADSLVRRPRYIILSDKYYGFLPAGNEEGQAYDDILTLVSGEDDIEGLVNFEANIKSRFFDETEYPLQVEATAIRDFINNNIREFLPMVIAEDTVTITFESDTEYHYHRLLNSKFA